MEYASLPMGSIIIAPAYLHAQIYKDMLHEKSGMLGLRVSSLQQLFTSYSYQEVPSLSISLFKVHNALRTQPHQWTTYRNVVDTHHFLKECYQFCDTMRFWDITLDMLPAKTSAQRELRDILSLFQELVLPCDPIKEALQHLQKQSLANTYIVDSFTTIEEEHLLAFLIAHGANRIVEKEALETKQFFHAVNKRQEIEGCAQHIIQHHLRGEDIHITLCDPTTQPLLQQIFQRYQIPFTLLQTKRTSVLIKSFIALFQYVLHPDNEHLLACLQGHIFMQKGLHALREYMQLFNPDFFSPFQHVNNIHETGNILDEHTLQDLQRLESNAKIAQEQLLPIFTKLKNDTCTQAMVDVVDIIQHTHIKVEDIDSYQQVIQCMQDVYPYIETQDDIYFMLDMLEGITSSDTNKTVSGVLVHNLTQTIYNRKHHYLLGATQSNYPAFESKKGIFDEPYFALLPAYPSMEERYTHHSVQLSHMLASTQHIYVSYPVGTYEGKSMECALAIEQFINAPSTSYPLQVNYVPWELQEELSPETALQLFLHEGKLHGSISSLERYVKCPFSYFLRYGLSLQEPMKPGFPDAYAGTLSHFVLETLTNAYGKAYATQTKDTIDAILTKEITHLQTLFPTMQAALCHVKKRLLIAMSQTISTLQDFEQHSTFAPAHSEYAFTYEIDIEDGYLLALRGYIDRIDQGNNLYCILDYKSSTKLLSETNVFAAVQLQLLTYAMVIAKQKQCDIMGAYYVSLKNENINCAAGSLARRKPITYHPYGSEDYAQQRQKAHRFHGWTMYKDPSLLDDDATHIAGLRQNKDGIIKATKLYNLTTITQYMETIYKTIAKQIMQGDISCKPLEDACTYCAYHAICRFHDWPREKTPYIEPDEELYQKGDDEHA